MQNDDIEMNWVVFTLNWMKCCFYGNHNGDRFINGNESELTVCVTEYSCDVIYQDRVVMYDAI